MQKKKGDKRTFFSENKKINLHSNNTIIWAGHLFRHLIMKVWSIQEFEGKYVFKNDRR
jgi:hypothetical protein